MCEAPAFHQAPRPVAVALRARAASSPSATILRHRVFGFFHCSHRILRRCPGENARNPGNGRCPLRVSPDAVTVPALHVGNLVGEDRRHFVVALKRLQQAPRHEDVPGRHGQRINVVRVDDLDRFGVSVEVVA